MKNKNCKHCNQVFVPTIGYQKFCSAECRELADKVQKTCRQCGQSYFVQIRFSKQSEFCSRQCAANIKRKRESAVCVQCKSTFEYIASNERGKFCSRECSRVHGMSRTIIKECLVCQAPITAIGAVRERKKFCSKKCMGTWLQQTSYSRRANGMTKIEQITSEYLDVLTLSYIHEQKLGKYRCDFYIPLYNLVIECDGTHWHSSEKAITRDAKKDAWLNGRGCTVLRLTEQEIKNTPEACIQKIRSTIDQLQPTAI